MTGATGFLGRALALRLRRDGHEVSAWVRSPAKAKALLGSEVELLDARGGDARLRGALAASDAVIHLAGEPVLPRRWTQSRRNALFASRVGLTDQIVQALAELPLRPQVLVSGSAVGFYGDRQATVLPEGAPKGTGFLADLCAAWEAAAEKARPLGVRVVTLRTGVVLGRDGGALAQLVPLQRARLGGVLGGGEQWLPWIHLHDWVELVVTALRDPHYSGAFNATAPHPVTQREFASEIGRVLGGLKPGRVPAAALRLALGSAATVLLASERAVPERAEQLGFHWSFPELPTALADVIAAPGVTIEALGQGPLAVTEPTPYLLGRPPSYVLRASVELTAPIEEVFAFFSRPENLGAMTPANLEFVMLDPVASVAAGARIDYRIRLGALPLRWRTTIERFRPPHLFIDSQTRGPYRSWWHEHRFRAEGRHTLMEDRVYYALPFGFLGRLVHRWFVVRALQRIFGFRSDAVRLRFGVASAPVAPAKRGAA